MQKILRRRTLRELKKNFVRYLALFFLIFLGMYIVISTVGSAETITMGVNKKSKEYKAEDGQFKVFAPLSDGLVEMLEADGVSIQKQFYMDFNSNEEKMLRVFEDRKEIDQMQLVEGQNAKAENELVLERNYARSNGLSVGDELQLGTKMYQITGIGVTSDYELPVKEISDSSAQSKQFGTVFVTEKAYKQLKETGEQKGNEVYSYSYLLNDMMTQNELKDRLLEIKVDTKEIADPYLKEMVDVVEDQRNALTNGIDGLQKGAGDLHSGLAALKDNNKKLNEGAEEIFSLYLQEANQMLGSMGEERNLNEENYSTRLQEESKRTSDASVAGKLRTLKETLDGIKEYKDGVKAYTDGEQDATKGSKELAKGMDELKKNTRRLINQTFKLDIPNLTMFLKKTDNPRIGGAVDDVQINKYTGIVAGIIIMILFTFVISVFVIHGIEKEHMVIGALYALGVKKHQLLIHYLSLPVIITLLGAIAGTMFSYTPLGIPIYQQSSMVYYSLSDLPLQYPLYLLVYGIAMPPVIAVIVNFLVINRKLGEAPLTLLRGEEKKRKNSKWNLHGMGYIRMFQLRQFLREMRSGIAILFGLLLSLMVAMIGITCANLCINMQKDTKRDTTYEYQYFYKYPTQTVPKGGEACYQETLKREIFGYNLDVSLLGIDEDNPYFNFQVPKGKNKVAVSSSTAEKYKLHVGDKLVLSDDINEKDYAFTVDRIVPYSVGLTVFMDITSMRELFGKEEQYYNVVYSNEALKVEEGRLYATTTKEDVLKTTTVFMDMMETMIISMVGISILIFLIVMYLMLKVAIDRSSTPIAIMKIFGYRDKEVKKLYLDGTFYLVAVGAAICIPIAKLFMDCLYPYFVSNVACGVNTTYPIWLYAVMYVVIIVCYLVINCLLVHRIHKVTPAEVLKNRE